MILERRIHVDDVFAVEMPFTKVIGGIRIVDFDEPRDLAIRSLSNRYDLPLELGVIISQTPRAVEIVDYRNLCSLTISREDSNTKRPSPESQ